MTDLEIYQEIIRLNKEGLPSALATIVESAGSSPRKSGAKMLVRNDGSTIGTIGGGKMEAEVIEAAVAVIQSGIPRAAPFSLTEEYGHVCGGKLLVYIEPVGTTPRLIIFGVGHVGRSLARIAPFSGFRVSMVDEREPTAVRERFDGADELIISDVEGAFAELDIDGNCYLVIVTGTHVDDFAAVKKALRTPARYIGLLGSRRKRAVLEKILADEGFGSDDINRITIPVGLPIGAESPAEIAVAIVAQLIQVRKGIAFCAGDSPSVTVAAPDGVMPANP